MFERERSILAIAPERSLDACSRGCRTLAAAARPAEREAPALRRRDLRRRDRRRRALARRLERPLRELARMLRPGGRSSSRHRRRGPTPRAASCGAAGFFVIPRRRRRARRRSLLGVRRRARRRRADRVREPGTDAVAERRPWRRRPRCGCGRLRPGACRRRRALAASSARSARRPRWCSPCTALSLRCSRAAISAGARPARWRSTMISRWVAGSVPSALRRRLEPVAIALGGLGAPLDRLGDAGSRGGRAAGRSRRCGRAAAASSGTARRDPRSGRARRSASRRPAA